MLEHYLNLDSSKPPPKNYDNWKFNSWVMDIGFQTQPPTMSLWGTLKPLSLLQRRQRPRTGPQMRGLLYVSCLYPDMSVRHLSKVRSLKSSMPENSHQSHMCPETQGPLWADRRERDVGLPHFWEQPAGTEAHGGRPPAPARREQNALVAQLWSPGLTANNTFLLEPLRWFGGTIAALMQE